MRLRAQVKQATGRTKHVWVPGGPVPVPAYVEITDAMGDGGWLLLYFNREGTELTDTWHESMQDAKDQAEWEFLISDQEWEVVGG